MIEVTEIEINPAFAPEYYEDLAENKRYLRTRKCGCGNCRMTAPTVEGCEFKLSKTANWLYVASPNKPSVLTTLEEGDPGYELREVTGTEQ